MKTTPSTPPTIPIAITVVHGRLYPSRSSAGKVNEIPAAIDSPADPVVCTMLFWRIDALTVRLTLSAR